MTHHARRWLLSGTAVTMAAVRHADASVPPPPAGWTQVFADDFTGAANTGVNGANWRYDLGTGEVETMTDSTQNVFQDGSGHLVIRPIRDAAGRWTSGRIETQRTDFAAP